MQNNSENKHKRRTRIIWFVAAIPLAFACLWVGNMVYRTMIDFEPYEPSAMTRENFLFSTFTERMLRQPISRSDNKFGPNPIIDEMEQTLLRLFPPGTDASEIPQFLKQVVENERKFAGETIERKTSDGYLKIRIFDSRERGKLAFHYRFLLSKEIFLINPLNLISYAAEYSYIGLFNIDNNKIISLRIKLSSNLW